MTTATPPLDPRVIALAQYASRAVLEKVPARHGLTFAQSVTLRLAAVAEGPLGRDALAGGLIGALKTDTAQAAGAVDALIATRLLAPEEPSLVRITDAGRELYGRISAATAPVTARVYAGISEEERAVAGRVLALVTERADAELAAPAD